MIVVSNRDVALEDINRHVDRTRKRCTLLDQMIAHQPKLPALREHRGFVVKRSIFEMKYEPASDPCAAGRLHQVAVGEQGAVECPKREETVYQSFHVTHGDWFAA